MSKGRKISQDFFRGTDIKGIISKKAAVGLSWPVFSNSGSPGRGKTQVKAWRRGEFSPANTTRRAGGRGGGVYETEAKMQTRVLDRMLGPGKAFAFLEMSAEITNTADEQSKDGVGELRKTKSSAGSMEEEAEPMGKEEDKKADKDKKALSTQEQSSRQVDCRKHNNIIEIIDSCAAKIA